MLKSNHLFLAKVYFKFASENKLDPLNSFKGEPSPAEPICANNGALSNAVSTNARIKRLYFFIILPASVKKLSNP